MRLARDYNSALKWAQKHGLHNEPKPGLARFNEQLFIEIVIKFDVLVFTQVFDRNIRKDLKLVSVNGMYMQAIGDDPEFFKFIESRVDFRYIRHDLLSGRVRTSHYSGVTKTRTQRKVTNWKSKVGEKVKSWIAENPPLFEYSNSAYYRRFKESGIKCSRPTFYKYVKLSHPDISMISDLLNFD